ncbi:hypothetical protein BFG51_17660 [Dietzia alimentaria]|nr:hypothetical protein BFG51_17660 [Dietzia alimentaria]
MTQQSKSGTVIRGTGVVAGLAYGPARWVVRQDVLDPGATGAAVQVPSGRPLGRLHYPGVCACHH